MSNMTMAWTAIQAIADFLVLDTRGLPTQSTKPATQVRQFGLYHAGLEMQISPREMLTGMAKRKFPPAPPGKRYVFRPWKRGPDGKILYASTYGFKAWPILVDA